MPSWKKVITSGSAAAFSSLTVSSTITGSISGSLTGSLQGTASWAQFVVNAQNINTSSLVTTSSFNAFTSSINTFTASYNTGSFSGSFTGSFNGTASWARNASTASFAPDYLLTSSFNTWTGSNSSRFFGTSSYANFTAVLRISGSLSGTVEDGNVYILPIYRSGNAVFGSTGSVYAASILSSTGILHYSASLDRLLTTASWAKEALTASYALTAPGISPQGNTNEIQYNVNGTNFGGVSTLTYDGADLIGTGSFTGRFDGNLRLGVFRGTRTTIPAPVLKGDEVLVYSKRIDAGTFTNDDIIRVHYRIDQATSDNAIYRIYIADTPEFASVSGSLTNLIANVTASSTVRYVGIKRDLSYDGSKLRFMNSGSTSTTDDIATTLPISEFTADLTGTEYYMFFSAIPNQVAHTSKALSYSIERI
jgi:hypothetical protein